MSSRSVWPELVTRSLGDPAGGFPSIEAPIAEVPVAGDDGLALVDGVKATEVLMTQCPRLCVTLMIG